MTTNHYCDSKELERNWFLWLVAGSTPTLEPYREAGVLWTWMPRTIVSQNADLRDPQCVEKKYIIALDYFYTFARNTTSLDSRVLQCTPNNIVFSKGMLAYPQPVKHVLDQQTQDLLIREDFFKEEPIRVTSEKVTNDIMKICQGVAVRFHPKSEDEKNDLAQGAVVQVLQKIRNNKLVFIPGKAPVFSLVTTTVYRCMCSIMNKNNKETRRRATLAEDLVVGAVKPNTRTLRTSKPS